jgi:hypothetical protein
VSDNNAAHMHGVGDQAASESWMTAAQMVQDAAPLTIPEGAAR